MEHEVKKFTIGDFTFDTFHEYRDGQEDLKKIDCINKELDIHDPEVTVRLYNMIRSGQIVFKSPIGEQFFSHIADIVADKSIDLLEDKAVVEEAESHVKYQKIIGLILASVAIVLFAYFGYQKFSDYQTARRLEELQAETKTTTNKTTGNQNPSTNVSSTDPFSRTTFIDKSTLSVLPEYQDLVNQNSDMVGWLNIPDTKINYPVVQKDNEYYLTHDFDGKEDSNGTLMVDERSDIVNPTTNTIIYGHNMKSGLMFGTLKSYMDDSFLQAHKTIEFNTIYEKRTYEVVAVCLSEVEYQDENSYRYYNFISANNQAEWDAFVANVESLKVSKEDVELSSSDKLLTLSTCNSYTEDGRLFIVAKRVN